MCVYILYKYTYTDIKSVVVKYKPTFAVEH